MLFDTWYDLLRILVVGVCAYAGLIVLLRATGKRTLAKMNAFDLVVTVALGSTMASALLSSDVSISEALVAFLTLCGLQFVVAWASIRSARVRALVKAEPALLVHRGVLLPEALRRERVGEEEVFAAIRAGGVARLGQVEAVVLETDGSFSVISSTEAGRADTLRHVRGNPGATGEG